MAFAVFTLAAFALMTGNKAAQVTYASDGKIMRAPIKAHLNVGQKSLLRREVKKNENGGEHVEMVEVSVEQQAPSQGKDAEQEHGQSATAAASQQSSGSTVTAGTCDDGTQPYAIPSGCCDNNTAGRDANNQTCADYQGNNSYMCGHFDTDDFSAFFHCCACQCVSDDQMGAITDLHGHSCDWYLGSYLMHLNGFNNSIHDTLNSVFGNGDHNSGDDLYSHSNTQQFVQGHDELKLEQGGGPAHCGRYDTDRFTANARCCACGGGMVLKSWEAEWTPAPPLHLTANTSRAGDTGYYHGATDANGNAFAGGTPPPGQQMWSSSTTDAPTPVPTFAAGTGGSLLLSGS